MLFAQLNINYWNLLKISLSETNLGRKECVTKGVSTVIFIEICHGNMLKSILCRNIIEKMFPELNNNWSEIFKVLYLLILNQISDVFLRRNAWFLNPSLFNSFSLMHQILFISCSWIIIDSLNNEKYSWKENSFFCMSYLFLSNERGALMD